MIFELKGDQFFDDNGIMQNPFDHSMNKIFEAKQQCMIKNDVVILRSSDYYMFELYVKQTYGNEYLKKFKISNFY